MAGRTPSRPGYLYVISEGNSTFKKIGLTGEDPNKRVKQLQTGNPRQLYVVRKIRVSNMKQCETFLHRMFGRYHIRGEWYNLSNFNEFDTHVKELGELILK